MNRGRTQPRQQRGEGSCGGAGGAGGPRRADVHAGPQVPRLRGPPALCLLRNTGGGGGGGVRGRCLAVTQGTWATSVISCRRALRQQLYETRAELDAAQRLQTPAWRPRAGPPPGGAPPIPTSSSVGSSSQVSKTRDHPTPPQQMTSKAVKRVSRPRSLPAHSLPCFLQPPAPCTAASRSAGARPSQASARSGAPRVLPGSRVPRSRGESRAQP